MHKKKSLKANENQVMKYESDVVSEPVKSGFSCVKSGTEVHTAGLAKFLLWKNLIVCHQLL